MQKYMFVLGDLAAALRAWASDSSVAAEQRLEGAQTAMLEFASDFDRQRRSLLEAKVANDHPDRR